MYVMVVTMAMAHFEMLPLNDDANQNMLSMVVTLDTSKSKLLLPAECRGGLARTRRRKSKLLLPTECRGGSRGGLARRRRKSKLLLAAEALGGLAGRSRGALYER